MSVFAASSTIHRLLLVTAVILIFSSARGSAQTPTPTPAPTARDLFIQGSESYRVGDYDSAITAWQHAYELDPRPLLLYNLGQAYERLGRLPEAIDSIARYLEAADPADTQRADATARLASMRERLARTSIVIVTDVEGARVFIDGEDRARTPRLDPIPVDPGTHTVVVELQGRPPFRSSVTVAAGMRSEVQVVLDTGGGGPREPDVDVVRPVGGYVLMGGGAGVAIVGVVLGFRGAARADQAVYSNDDDAAAARGLARSGDALLFGGLAAAAGGVLWLFLGAKEVEHRPQTAGDWELAPAVGPGVYGANAAVRF